MKLAVFDFDRTLFPKDTIPYLMKQWYKLEYPKSKIMKVYIKLLPAYIVYKLGIGGAKTNLKLRNQAIEGFDEIFKGMNKAEIENFFYKTSQNLNNELNEDIVNKVKKAQEEGIHTVIISGAYEPLLQLVGNPVAVNPDIHLLNHAQNKKWNIM